MMCPRQSHDGCVASSASLAGSRLRVDRCNKSRRSYRVRMIVCRVAVALAAVAMAVLLPARPAAAHAVLASSDPANGALLRRAPAVAVMRFSEDLTPTGASARLVDAAGTPIAGTRIAGNSANHRELTVHLPQLAAGSYAVVWQVSGVSDGHPTNGILVFTIDGAIAVSSGQADGGPSDALIRWLRLVLLSGLVGGLVMAGLILAPVASGESGRQLVTSARPMRRESLLIATVCAGAIAGVMIAGFAWRPPTAWRLGQMALCAAAIPALLRLRQALTLPHLSRYSRRAGWIVVAALAGAACLLEAIASDASDRRPLPVSASYLQVLGGCVVVGLVGVLAVVLWRPEPAGVERGAVIRSRRRPLVRWTVVGGALATAGGLYTASHEVDSVAELSRTVAGVSLLVEIGLVFAACGLGLVGAARLLERRTPAAAHRRVRPRRLLPRPLLAAGLACVLALLGTGVVADAVATGPSGRAVASPSIHDGHSDDLLVSVSAVPNRPGPNGFMVEVASNRRPPPAPVERVELSYPDLGSTSVPLADVGHGRFFGTVTLGPTAVGRLVVQVRRGGAEVSVPVGWSMPVTAAPTRTGSLARLVNVPIAVLLTCLVALGAWWSLLSRRQWRVDV